MKKVFKLLCVFFFFLLLGCSKEKYTICKLNLSDDESGYSLNVTSKIYYDDKYVKKIQKDEIYYSKDEDILNYFSESKSLDYDYLDDLYGGFKYSVSSLDNSVNFTTTIDLDKVNIKKMVRERYLDKNYVISNKLTISGIKYFYGAKGFICDI